MTTQFQGTEAEDTQALDVDFTDFESSYRASVPLSTPAQSPQDSTGREGPSVDEISKFVLEHRKSAGIHRVIGDTVAMLVAAVEAAVLQGAVRTVHTHGIVAVSFNTMIMRLLVSVPVIVVILSAHFRSHVRRSFGLQMASVAPLVAIGGALCIVGWHVAQGAGLVIAPPDDALIEMCAFGILAVAAARMAYEAPPIDEAGTRTKRFLIVGSGAVADRLMETLHAEAGVGVVGFVDDDPKNTDGWLGKLGNLSDCCLVHDVDHVIVAFSRASSEDIIEALRPIEGRLPITVVPRLFEILPMNASLHELGTGITGITVPTATLHGPSRFLKRVIDMAGAGLALTILSPVLLLVALAVRLTSQGPVLFRQARTGRGGKEFEVLKFRSMYVGQETEDPATLDGTVAIGPFPKLKNDPRVTAVGRFIRRTSLDELPQFWNVLRGDMSLVGPRPFIPRESAIISGWAQRRYSVRPGITGLWQVSGRNNLTFEEMCRLDSLYVSSWSVVLDLRILVRTLRVVVSSTGAF